MDTNPELNREIEYENAEQAFQGYKRTGHTNRRCLRCDGKLLFYDGGSGYKIWCEQGDYTVSITAILSMDTCTASWLSRILLRG